MSYLKASFFGIPALVVFIVFVAQILPLLQDYNFIFSLDISTLYQLLTLTVLLLISALLFTIFLTLSADWWIVFPLAVIASATPLLFVQNFLGLTLTGGFLFSFITNYFLLEKKLNTYLTFQPASLLLPSVKQLFIFVVLVLSLAFYLGASVKIKKEGFQIPDSLIEMSLKFAPQEGAGQASGLDQVKLSPEHIALLKQNPQALKQYGLDPSVLDQVDKSPTKSGSQDQMKALVKATLQKQFDTLVKPYTDLIPLILAVVFYFTFKSLSSFLSIPLSPLVWLIFFIMEKLGVTHYEVEQREVKKLVV